MEYIHVHMRANSERQDKRRKHFYGMGPNIKITDNSKIFVGAMKDAKAAALEAIGFQAEGYAKLIAPVDTGRLRNSLTHAVAESESTVYVGTNVEYAAYVEFGTSRTRAQPYLKPAVTGHTDEYKAIAERVFKDASE